MEINKTNSKENNRFSKTKAEFSPKYGFISTSKAGEIKDGKIRVTTNFISKKTISQKVS